LLIRMPRPRMGPCSTYNKIKEDDKTMSFVPVPAAVLNQWVRILGALEKKINRQSYETWLKPTRFSHISGRTLHVR
jgi:hypothetical protein